jgi:hypothetical protein
MSLTGKTVLASTLTGTFLCSREVARVMLGRNFPLAAEIVKAAMGAGISRAGSPREVVDVPWSLFMGLVHLSETRENVGLRSSTLAELHARAFDWRENGSRRRP